MIWLLAACTPQTLAPERPDCTRTSDIDAQGDGSFERTDTTVYDAEGRVVRTTSEGPDYFYEQVFSYDGDCVAEVDATTEYDNGDVYTEGISRVCDDNGDPVELQRTSRASGSQSYSFHQDVTWDRTYGENGLTSEALRVDTYGRGFEIESLEQYAYDELDRMVWYLSVRDDAATQRTWVYDEELDLVLAEESRNGFGVLTSASYRTYDDRGREIEVVSLDEERAETVYTRSWEKKRWADTHLEVSFSNGASYEAEIVCNDEDPWTERTASYDGWTDERDGVADYVEVQTYSCP